MRNELPGKLVTLRLLKKEYIPAYLEMFCETIRKLLHIKSKDTEKDYLLSRILRQDQIEQREKVRSFFYCIFTPKDELIGAIEIREAKEHPGQLHAWVNPDYWGTGQFQEAIALASDEYFKQTNQDSFTAHVDVTNKRSYHALKKAGFVDVGMFDGPYGKQYKLILQKK